MHMIRSTDPHFKKFGEIYFSKTLPGVIKGWKLHKEIFQHMVVPEGKIQIVLYDARKDSGTFGKTQSIQFGEDNYSMVIVPPNVWYSFKAISNTPAFIANCTTAPHDPKESTTLPLDSNEIPFRW